VRRRRTSSAEAESSQDSFLDIVANLVGIMIILVMVVGVRARDALVEAAVSRKSVDELQVDVETPRLTGEEVQRDIHAIQEKLSAVQRETQRQHQFRNQMVTLLRAAQHIQEERRQDLDESDRRNFDPQQATLAAHNELEDLARNRQSLERQADQSVVLEHLPTPLAKTVFGKEVHFRLLHGRLAYVPLNELVDILSDRWKKKIWKLKESSEFVETIGPIHGFRMKYTIGKETHAVSRHGMVQQKEIVQVTGFHLIPIADDLGEPFEAALSEQSHFRQILSGYDSKQTTVTVWTYPESFQEFRRLKEELYRLGYLTAGRPLPDNYPIGGSPTGSRSAAQ
jgi:hypothetical protein